MADDEGGQEITVGRIRRRPAGEYESVEVETDRGPVRMRYYPAPGAARAVVFIGGVGGDWDSPGRDELYPRLCRELQEEGLAALRVHYRQPTDLEESVLDVLTSLHFLGQEGVRRFGIVGHSFGGAVAAQAAANHPGARALVTLATQAQGLEAVTSLPPGCASLFVHGTGDSVLPPTCSQYGYRNAREPRFLRIFEGANHCLDEVADELRPELFTWLRNELGGAGVQPTAR